MFACSMLLLPQEAEKHATLATVCGTSKEEIEVWHTKLISTHQPQYYYSLRAAAAQAAVC
jgi:hypothetical protein